MFNKILIYIFIPLITIAISYIDLGSASAGIEYTDDEKIALKKFRRVVNDSIVHEYQSDDTYLITWLRARDMNINKAAEMFRASQKWRAENKIDTIANETLLEFKSPPYTLSGYDFDGNPILIFTPTHIDLRRLLIQGHRDEVVRMWWQMMERTAIKRRESQEKFGKNATGSVSVLDLHGFNFKQHFCLPCIPVYTAWFTSLEKYYPARVKHFVMINVPRVAIPFVDLVRPLLSPITEKVFKVFPPNKKEWTAYLQKIAPADQLPYRFGGTQKN